MLNTHKQIRYVLYGKYKTAYKFQWCFVGEENKILNVITRKKWTANNPEFIKRLENKKIIKDLKQKGIEEKRKYYQSTEYIEIKKLKQNKKCRDYNKTEAGKASKRKYYQTEAGKQKKKECNRKYYQTEAGKQKKKEEKKRYKERKKLQLFNNQGSP